jgi:hypothetical protein
MLSKKLVNCHIFDNYLLKQPTKNFVVCSDCICRWACFKIIRNDEKNFKNEIQKRKDSKKSDDNSPMKINFRKFSESYNENVVKVEVG